MEETIYLTAIRGILQRLAKKPLIISIGELKLSYEGYTVRISGIKDIVIDAVKEEQ